MSKTLSTIMLKYYPKIFILCYHRIIPKSVALEHMVHRALYVTPETFEKHIIWMKDNGKIISINDILFSKKETGFIITFDDGWKDNFEYAFPILKQYNVDATIFISTNNVDKGILFWTEELCFLVGKAKQKYDDNFIISVLKDNLLLIFKKNDISGVSFTEKPVELSYYLDRIIECLKLMPDNNRNHILSSIYKKFDVSPCTGNDLLLSWNDISVMAKENIQFGSHTHTHALLDRVDNKTVDYELSKSKELLEEKIGSEVYAFAYPNGYFNNNYIQESLLKNGYKFGFTLNGIMKEQCNPLLVPRCLIFEDISYSMQRYYIKLLLKYFWNKFCITNV